MGNVLEWYDFALFGVLAPVIATHFFPSADPLAGLINSYAVFAIGFLARPLGGVIFGHIGDRFGRRQALVLSVTLMAVPTSLMGLLPTYQEVGVLAPILLTLLRIVQGISTGGEFSGSIIFLVEQAPGHRRGFYGSVANFGAMIGGLLGAAVGWLMSEILTPDAMQDWGWRVLFFTGILVGLFGLWARVGVPDTPVFAQLAASQGLQPRPLRTAWRHERWPMAIAMGLNWSASVAYYVVFVWFVGNMSEVIGLSYQTALGVSTFGLVAGLLATLAIGHLSDVVGHKRMLVAGSIATVDSLRSAIDARGHRHACGRCACPAWPCALGRDLSRHVAGSLCFTAWPGGAVYGSVGQLQHGAGLVWRHRPIDRDVVGEGDGLAGRSRTLSGADGARLLGARPFGAPVSTLKSVAAIHSQPSRTRPGFCPAQNDKAAPRPAAPPPSACRQTSAARVPARWRWQARPARY